MSNPTAQPGLAERLRNVRVGTRTDLETSRHLFRGEPSYVVRDPLTFHSHRFNPADYRLFVAIDASRPLCDIFKQLVASEVVSPDDEERFYNFVFGLHRSGFLALPISDDKLLFQRFERRQAAKRREKLMGFLFYRVPLWNPDAFLNRTMRAAAPLFTIPAFILWLTLIATAGLVGVARWNDLCAPVNGLLAAANLPLIWCVLILLKAWHEFGHAYACKHFGGHVPEMGVYLIAFTPCAYVDASASWGFSKRRQRLIVSLGGMYFESMVAAVALLVWAATAPSLLNSLAYNVIFLAGVITLLFNINPLMRYDGYYILSDLLEIPNLRARATQYATAVLKRLTLGIKTPLPTTTPTMKAWLLTFGLLASAYRILIFLGIATLVATKFFFVGLALAAAFLGNLIYGIGRKVVQYCWFADETAPLRARAITVSILGLLVAPTVIALVPFSTHAGVRAVVTAQRETVIRAAAPGFIHACPVDDGARVAPSQTLLTLHNADLKAAEAAAAGAARAAELRRDALRIASPAEAARAEHLRAYYDAAHKAATREVAALHITAPGPGDYASRLPTDKLGRWVETGTTLGVLYDGALELRTVLDETRFDAAQPTVGTRVRFRSHTDPTQTLNGTITRVQPAGARSVNHEALLHQFGGEIVVDPQSGLAQRPYFEITIQLDGRQSLPWGSTGNVEFNTQPTPLALQIFRSLIRFTDKLYQS